jgi:hypothetical protein
VEQFELIWGPDDATGTRWNDAGCGLSVTAAPSIGCTVGAQRFQEPTVPVTARLSKLFYDRFGDQVVDELVNWLNSVDATYRSDLRELNEINFARFDAKMEQRFAEQDAKLEKRFAEQDAKFEKRFAEQDMKFEKFEKRFTELEARFESSIKALDAKIDGVAGDLRVTIERALKEQTRWMVVIWTSLLIPIIGLWMR